jgi:Domain of unknown function (DUF6378)
MMAVIDETLNERAERYGKFIDNARIAQFLKLYIRGCPSWKELEADQREALDNIMIKTSRILSNGTDVNYTDNWHDIAGYATLVVERLNGNAR